MCVAVCAGRMGGVRGKGEALGYSLIVFCGAAAVDVISSQFP